MDPEKEVREHDSSSTTKLNDCLRVLFFSQGAPYETLALSSESSEDVHQSEESEVFEAQPDDSPTPGPSGLNPWQRR